MRKELYCYPMVVHTENKQKIVLEENNEINALDNWKTTLTAWFDLNKNDEFANNIKYVNIPDYYTFNETNIWVKLERKQKHYAIGRLNIVSPKDSERFSLKLILGRIKGANSFKDLRTYENVTYNTHKEAAIAMDLIENDLKILKFFEEACRIMLPFQLREFFTSFLLTENIQGNIIWNNLKKYFSEDFHENEDNLALNDINKLLLLEDVPYVDFGLPEPDPIINDVKYDSKITSINKEMFEDMFTKLNQDQKFIFKQLLNNINKINFIGGPRGSGKTFLYKTLNYYFLSKVKNIISMPWTGIASILLSKGMITDRTFRLPLDLSSIENSF